MILSFSYSNKLNLQYMRDFRINRRCQPLHMQYSLKDRNLHFYPAYYTTLRQKYKITPPLANIKPLKPQPRRKDPEYTVGTQI